MGIAKMLGLGAATVVAAGVGLVAEAIVIANQHNELQDSYMEQDYLRDVIGRQQVKIDKMAEEIKAYQDKGSSQDAESTEPADSVNINKEQVVLDKDKVIETAKQVMNDATQVFDGLISEAHHMVDRAMTSEKTGAAVEMAKDAFNAAKESDTVKGIIKMATDAHTKIHKSIEDLVKSVEEASVPKEQENGEPNNDKHE